MKTTNKQNSEKSALQQGAVSGSLFTKIYEIDFGGNVRVRINVIDNKIEVEAAINGWGDDIPLSDIRIEELQ